MPFTDYPTAPLRDLRHRFVLMLGVLLVYPGVLPAVEDEGALAPPRLLELVEAEYPRTPGIPDSGKVTARLHVDEKGVVTGVEIVSASHPAFVPPARAAMAAFRFHPARRNGVPIPSIVIYRYEFTAPPAPEPASPDTSKNTNDTFTNDTPISNFQSEDTLSPSDADEPESGFDEDVPYETIVRDQRIYSVSAERLGAEDIKRIPGIHGDAVLAVQTLPGVGKPPAMLGALFIRGSDDADSLSLVDSLPVPTVFHFGAINTVLNSDMIEAVTFLPGNFSVRYGRGTGGVVDIETRAPKPDRLHAYLDIDLWDVSVFAEVPITKHWSIAASFRRSYIDGVLRATHLLEKQLQFTAAPRYYDFQVKSVYEPNAGNTLSLLIFGSDDRVAFGGDLLNDASYLSREIYTRTYFYMAGAEWVRRFGRTASNTLSIRGGFLSLKGDGTSVTTRRRSVPFYFRDELVLKLSPALTLRTGIDGGIGHHRIRALQKVTRYTTQKKHTEGHPGAYAELELNALPRTAFIYGFRIDYDSLSKNVDIDPRFEFRFSPLDHTLLKGGLGLFHQAAGLYYALEDTHHLKSMAAIHYHLGLSQTIPWYRSLSFDLGGFYKDLRRVTFDHRGSGRVVGLEVMLNHRPSRRFFGWISYTLMKSERTNTATSKRVPFDFDQTHVLTIVAGLALDHHIGLGLRFRFASGFPYTPIVGYQFVEDWSAATLPIWDENNSGRMPAFHQLDLRVDKTFSWRYVSLMMYLDVQNVYNRHNPIFYIYNEDFTQKNTIYDLPVLPSIGVKVTY